MWTLLLTIAALALCSVHYAQRLAARFGPILGTLILALAVTVIEAGFIISVMAADAKTTQTLARDTVFSSLMLCCNGMIGLSLLVSTRREQIVKFDAFITGAAFATVATVATLSMVLLTFTSSTSGPQFNTAQLTFASCASVVLYVLHVVKSTGWLHEYVNAERRAASNAVPIRIAKRPNAVPAVLLLLSALVAITLAAQILAPSIESMVQNANLPISSVGVMIAIIVALPETLTAMRAAHAGEVQVSFNLALGSAMASLGLTIPVVAVAANFMQVRLTLGLGPKEMVFLVLTTVVGILTVVSGRASVLRGSLHTTICCAFVFMAFFP
ncbi:hypothetical protein SG18_22070 [Pandoraea apista]|nr:hypothetical protein SG18_22070 [Pandoraea apista]AKH75509.1 hypothetical protein XM39_22250 [Pandoraea apista]AKI64865.1 hypothetical protein AA956_15575 [Pandoraea apista]